jgi:hypothetical protein
VVSIARSAPARDSTPFTVGLEVSIAGARRRSAARLRRARRRVRKKRVSACAGSPPRRQCTVTPRQRRARASMSSSKSARVALRRTGAGSKQMRVARATPSSAP